MVAQARAEPVSLPRAMLAEAELEPQLVRPSRARADLETSYVDMRRIALADLRAQPHYPAQHTVCRTLGRKGSQGHAIHN